VAYFLVLAVIFFAMLPALLSTLSALDQEQHALDPAQTATSQMLVGALNQETGARGYALSGRASFLEPYRMGADQYAEATRTLGALDLGGDYRARVGAAEQAFARWHELATQVLATVQARPGQSTGGALEQGQAKIRFDDFRTEQARLAALVSHDSATANRSLRSTVVRSLVRFVGALLLGVLVGVGLLLWWRTTGRRAAQAEVGLADQARLVQAAIDASPDSIFVKDLDGRHLLANRARAEALSGGRTDVDLVGHRADDFVDPATADTIRRNEAQVVATGEARQFEEVLPIRGQDRHFAVTKNVLRDAEGRPVGIVGVARDVTDERARLAELQRLYAVERDIAHRLQESMIGRAEVEDPRIEVCACKSPGDPGHFRSG
jgi:PAS domain S-box-containing protein